MTSDNTNTNDQPTPDAEDDGTSTFPGPVLDEITVTTFLDGEGRMAIRLVASENVTPYVLFSMAGYINAAATNQLICGGDDEDDDDADGDYL